nr:MEDS domain-containing protein [uncultured Actinoplanes sp.]
MTSAIEAGHACWSYDDLQPFDEYARDFLRTGLAAGERVWFVPGRRPGTTADWLRGVAAAARPGAVRITSVEDAYVGEAAVDPAGQVAFYRAETEDALAAGFTGLRVVADVTRMIRTDLQREAFARYEYVIGRYMRTAPMRAVCAYDRLELGDGAVAELACLHEVSQAAGVTFQLHPGATTAAAVLDGELDMSVEDLFSRALRHTDLAAADGEVTVDADGLRFIDHRSLLALQRYAEDSRMTAVLRTRLDTTARLADLLELSNVRVEIAR